MQVQSRREAWLIRGVVTAVVVVAIVAAVTIGRYGGGISWLLRAELWIGIVVLLVDD